MKLDLTSLAESGGKPITITIEETTRVVLQYPGTVRVGASVDTDDPAPTPSPTPTPTPMPTPAADA